VYLVGQAGVAAAEKRGVGELVGGRGRVSGENAPEDGERGGVAAGARVVGYGRCPRGRRTAVANLPWCEEVAVARQPQRHSFVFTDTLLHAFTVRMHSSVQVCAECLNSFSFLNFLFKINAEIIQISNSFL
jgi:hypothetical protein